MSTRRILAIALAVLLVGLPGVAGAQSKSVLGSISGSVDSKTLKSGASYMVRLRDVQSGQVIKTESLDSQGRYSFANVPLGHKYVVELFDPSSNKVVGASGAITVSTATAVAVTGIALSAGAVAAGVPAALWLLAAGAGTASAVAVATQSGSR